MTTKSHKQNLFTRYAHLAILCYLLFLITNVKGSMNGMEVPFISNNSQNQQIELVGDGHTHEVKVNMKNKIIAGNNQMDLLSTILNEGNSSLWSIIFLYLEANDLRKSYLVCKTFYNIIHSQKFLESRAEMEMQRILDIFLKKLKPQLVESIGPYEIQMKIPYDASCFLSGKFEREKYYFPFSLKFDKIEDDILIRYTFLPSKNIQEKNSVYLEPEQKPFDSNVSFGVPGSFLTYKLHFENKNELCERVTKNKITLKVKRKRDLIRQWIFFISLLGVEIVLSYGAATFNDGLLFPAIFIGVFTLVISFYLMHETITECKKQ